MFAIQKFKAEHVNGMKVQETQDRAQMLSRWGFDDWKQLEQQDLCYSAWRDDVLIGIGGIMPQWPGRAQAWMLVMDLNETSQERSRKWMWAFRAIGRFLDGVQKFKKFRRIETTVDLSFSKGHRLAKMLGFHAEGILVAYDPAGRDHVMYARVKKNG